MEKTKGLSRDRNVRWGKGVAFGLVILETLTGLPVCNPDTEHCNLLDMFEGDLDTPTKMLSNLDKRGYWDHHK